MKAMQLQDYGGFEQLRYTEIAMPPVGDQDVLVRVHTASSNHIDPLRASGVVKHIYPLIFPWIPGRDFAGTVEQVGARVTNFKLGDAVFGDSATGGTYAEYIAVPTGTLAYKPRTLSFQQAAAVPVAAQTAWQALFVDGQLSAGQTVLVQGGAGAVGGYAVQLAHQQGAIVLATASATDIDYVRSLGANRVYDYRTTDIREHHGQLDLVIDLVGGPVQQQSYALLKAGGRLITTNQPISAEEAARHQVTAKFIHVSASGQDLNRLTPLFEQKRLHVDIARIYPLEEADLAWQDLARNLSSTRSVAPQPLQPARPKGHGKLVLELVKPSVEINTD